MAKPTLSLNHSASNVTVRASGSWNVERGAAKDADASGSSRTASCREQGDLEQQVQEVEKSLADILGAGSCTKVVLAAENLETWDSLLLALYVRLSYAAKDVELQTQNLPEGMGKLLDLARQRPPQGRSTSQATQEGFLGYLGGISLTGWESTKTAVEFLGEVTCSLGRFFTGRASCSSRDVWDAFYQCGVAALPIVSLTSLLLGLILAFVSSVQLKLFGAEIYISALVSIAMVRVMGPVLTAIVLSGRTGASFAAIIGSMQVNEEVDALTTFGISPIDFLVLPRVLALTLMTPLLTLYADVMSIAGGFVVAVFSLDISPTTYWSGVFESLTASHIWIGLLHSVVFGFLISMAGCYQGLNCPRSASGVGQATTTSVVHSIVGIILVTSLITLVCMALGV